MIHLVIFMSRILHLEELALYGGSAEAKSALERLLAEITSTFPRRFLSKKIDGSPAFVVGRRPDGMKFVSTKSFFNKTPIVYYSREEIESSSLSIELTDILLEIWSSVYWPSIEYGRAYQGDFIKSHKESQSIAQANLLYYPTQPKTTYAAVHTVYNVDMSLIASGRTTDRHELKNIFIGSFSKRSQLMDISVVGSCSTWSVQELKSLFSMINKDLDHSKETKAIVIKFLTDLSRKGHRISSLTSPKFSQRFVRFCDMQWVLKSETLKTRDAIRRWHQIYETAKLEFIRDSKLIYDICIASEELKSLLIADFSSVGACFVEIASDREAQMLSPTTDEGLVFDYGPGLVKIVNRYEFSHFNFSSSYTKRYQHRRD